MRALIVAALLATAALAHVDCNPRGCSGVATRGLCTNDNFDFFNICPFGEVTADIDARMPVDTGCMSIQPYAVESRDTNGTTNAISYIHHSGSSTRFGAWPTNCTAYPHCVKRSDENNLTYTGRVQTFKSSSPTQYVDRNGDSRFFSGHVDVSYNVVRQAAKMVYGNDQAQSVSFNNGDVFMSFELFSSNAGTFPSHSWIAPTDELWYLFRISNHGSNPFQMSLSSGARPTANGITFFEKAVNATGMYSTEFPTVWVTPEMKVVKRYEINQITWKYEVSEFLAVKLANGHSQMRLLATIARP